MGLTSSTNENTDILSNQSTVPSYLIIRKCPSSVSEVNLFSYFEKQSSSLNSVYIRRKSHTREALLQFASKDG